MYITNGQKYDMAIQTSLVAEQKTVFGGNVILYKNNTHDK
jgi:hypothetical protein